MSNKRYALIATIGTSDVKLPPEILAELGKKFIDEAENLVSRAKENEDSESHLNKYLAGVVKNFEDAIEAKSHAKTHAKTLLDYPSDKLLEHLKKEGGFPLIEQIVGVTDKSFKGEDETIAQYIKKIYLIATENGDKGRDSKKDTLGYAELIKKYLLDAVTGFGLTKNDIEIITLKANAELYDVVYNEIITKIVSQEAVAGEKFIHLPAKTKDDNATDDGFDLVYVLPTGGTAAMSSALLVAAAREYKGRLRVLYALDKRYRPAGKPIVATELAIGRTLYLQQLTDNLRTLIGSYDYSGALKLAEDKNNKGLFRDTDSNYLAVTYLLNHAQQRLLFNFDTAENNLHKYLKLEKNLVESKGDDGLCAYYPLKNKEVYVGNPNAQEEALNFGRGAIAELYWHIDLQWHTKRYADYLARLKTLADRINFLSLELITGIPISFIEASLNQSFLDKSDFGSLGGFYEIYIKNITDKILNKKGKLTSISRTQITNSAGQLAKTICEAVNHDLNKSITTPRKAKNSLSDYILAALPLDVEIQHIDSAKNPFSVKVSVKDDYYIDFKLGKKDKPDIITNLLKIVDDDNPAMLALTRLRNSLPPAHSFGRIDKKLILDAAEQGGWTERNPPHEVIGKALARLECFQDARFRITADLQNSPFEEINRRLNGLLDKIVKASE